MKVRSDFVANSSSSSFIIAKRYLDSDQIEAIRDHHEFGKKMGLVENELDFPWHIEENTDFITGYTNMDNFDMESFLNNIEVNSSKIIWSSNHQFQLLDNCDIDRYNNKMSSSWREMLYED